MYDYKKEKKKLFTDEGQKLFLRMRDHINKLLIISGAARVQEMMKNECAESWTMLACIDRLVELGEIREINQNTKIPTQYEIYVKNEK